MKGLKWGDLVSLPLTALKSRPLKLILQKVRAEALDQNNFFFQFKVGNYLFSKCYPS